MKPSIIFTLEQKKLIMKVTGYKQVSYDLLQELMGEKFNNYKEVHTEIQLAVAINVKSPQTVRNAFQKDMQMVSDEVLTTLIEAIGINGCVIWEKGVRNYYVKSK